MLNKNYFPLKNLIFIIILIFIVILTIAYQNFEVVKIVDYYCAAVVSIILLLPIKAFKQTVILPATTPKKFFHVNLIIVIITSFLLFLSSAILLLNHYLISNQDLIACLTQLLKDFSITDGRSPWNFILIFIPILILLLQQHHKNIFFTTLIKLANRIFIALTVTLFWLAFTMLLFNKFFKLNTSLMVTLVLLIAVSYSARFKSIEKFILLHKKLKIFPIWMPILLISLLLLFLFFTLFLKLSVHLLDPATQQILTTPIYHYYSKIFLNLSLKDILALWSWSWWILATPWLATRIMQIAVGHSLRGLVFWVLLYISILGGIVFLLLNQPQIITHILTVLTIKDKNIFLLLIFILFLSLSYTPSFKVKNLLGLSQFSLRQSMFNNRIRAMRGFWLLIIAMLFLLIFHPLNHLLALQLSLAMLIALLTVWYSFKIFKYK